MCYRDGLGVDKNEEIAAAHFKRAADSGDTNAMCDLGVYYLNRKDKKNAITCFIQAAKKGHITATYNLGVCFQDGLGVRKNKKMAVKYFTQIAEKGHVKAMYNLGMYYYDRKDWKNAITYFTQAANKGHVEATSKLGVCYLIGHGVPKNEEEAVKYLKQAVNNGSISAMYCLGQYYQMKSEEYLQ